ncbi:hypothetical protein ACQK5W_14715 [Pantoea sp. FN060301]|uniref:hypothetical protein n=1 Tax=Pantoea sp. FN060301 TaxID=3420380 RepID=UPI003D16F110
MIIGVCESGPAARKIQTANIIPRVSGAGSGELSLSNQKMSAARAIRIFLILDGRRYFLCECPAIHPVRNAAIVIKNYSLLAALRRIQSASTWTQRRCIKKSRTPNADLLFRKRTGFARLSKIALKGVAINPFLRLLPVSVNNVSADPVGCLFKAVKSSILNNVGSLTQAEATA